MGRRVVHSANLPLELFMPTTLDNISEIAFKTIPSFCHLKKPSLRPPVSLQLEKLRTLNMEGKKKKSGRILLAKPDYKKAYVNFKNPLSLSPVLFPLRHVQEEKERLK
ncbi:hypothetical protein Tsubulata_002185 [Turnera subulata]|uniref:Large ribosomal subunit protein uL23m n=1 Tax=Turnera subulata TaxID=218843 RepID=A0A9Q0J9V6_9ROSI|nr:hypothetical protein Tsubulata_002185 [Turnera subulata]